VNRLGNKVVDSTSIIFVAAGLVCFSIVALSLKTGRTVGLIVRSRFIARRKHETYHFWGSISVWAAFGLLLIWAAVQVHIWPDW
jgi:hypothetical protein